MFVGAPRIVDFRNPLIYSFALRFPVPLVAHSHPGLSQRTPWPQAAYRNAVECRPTFPPLGDTGWRLSGVPSTDPSPS